MIVEDAAKLDPLDRFLYWIKERHGIYLRRMAGKPKPWTDDEILQSYFFCNPYRENDKVTKWVAANIRDVIAGPNVIFAVIAFRWFNWIPTGEALLGRRKEFDNLLLNWDLGRAINRLECLQENNEKVFTGAFTITTGGKPGPKLETVCNEFIHPVWEDRIALMSDSTKWNTLAEAFKRLSVYPGFGGSGFMAAQVIADIKHTPVLCNATDRDTWCSLGPGSRRGLNLLVGRDPDVSILAADFIQGINEVRGIVAKCLPRMPKLDAQDIQNCCCEYSKYERILATGKSKRKFEGV